MKHITFFLSLFFIFTSTPTYPQSYYSGPVTKPDYEWKKHPQEQPNNAPSGTQNPIVKDKPADPKTHPDSFPRETIRNKDSERHESNPSHNPPHIIYIYPSSPNFPRNYSWGAISLSSENGKFYQVDGFNDAQTASSSAMDLCNSSCDISISYKTDDCVFIVRGYLNSKINYYWYVDNSYNYAEKKSLDKCSEQNNSSCEVIYNKCM